MTTERQLRVIEFAFWVVAVTAIIVTFSVLLGFATGGGFLTAKYILFVLGTLLVGLGTLGMHPKRPQDDEKRFSFTDSQSRLEAYIQQLPPLRSEGIRFNRRINRGSKLFVTGLVILAISLLLELGFGIALGASG